MRREGEGVGGRRGWRQAASRGIGANKKKGALSGWGTDALFTKENRGKMPGIATVYASCLSLGELYSSPQNHSPGGIYRDPDCQSLPERYAMRRTKGSGCQQ